MCPAQCVDVSNRIRRQACEPQRLVGATQGLQRKEFDPPRLHEAAVAPTRPTAADVGLQQHNIGRRFELLDAQRRVQPGVTAADDAHGGA